MVARRLPSTTNRASSSFSRSAKRKWSCTTGLAVFTLLAGVLVYSGYVDVALMTWPSRPSREAQSGELRRGRNLPPPLTCPPHGGSNLTCPHHPPPVEAVAANANEASSPVCPEYFRWIHEDLRPWKETGITREMLRAASKTAYFRMVLVKGRPYVHWYRQAPDRLHQRAVFTVWGLLQLLRRYPGRVPDFDLTFDCFDIPRIRVAGDPPPKGPPALFHYCGDDSTADIVFPDWSFWGWPETNIKPWEELSEEMKQGNRKTRWVDRAPYAYWKGNPAMTPQRRYLVHKCNVSAAGDWNARLFVQNWATETRTGFQTSELSSQCNYRYKIYMEGKAWSVSQKYIMACDSPNLLVSANFYEFFTRSLMPMQHYWPVKTVENCTSIKFAVAWGNQHQKQAEAIGKEGSYYILEKVKMDYVYDYMFHLLNEYSKLLKFQPTPLPNAVEYCSEMMACGEEGLKRDFMMKSMVNVSRSSDPCRLPPPFDPLELEAIRRKKVEAMKQVEDWERTLKVD